MPRMHSYRKNHIAPKIKKLKPRKKFFQKMHVWLVFGCFAAAAAIAYSVLFLPKCQVHAVIIAGNQRIATHDIESVAWQSISNNPLAFKSKSIFLVNKSNLAARILREFPGIARVTVVKKFPDVLGIELLERQPFAVFCIDLQRKNCFYMDAGGVIFDVVKNIPPDMTLVVEQGVNTSAFAGEDVVSEKAMAFIYEVKKNLKENFSIDVKEALVSNPLIFTTSENWKAYFDPYSPLQSQVDKMNILLKNQISPEQRKNLQYIYLQYKDRAYYK